MSHISTLYTMLFFIYSLFNLSIGDLETSTVSLTTEPDISIQIKIDTDTNTVAMTIQGPSNRWFGVGFGVSMAGTYTIISDESGQVFEQILGEYGQGQRISTININVCSNIVEASNRIITLILPRTIDPYYTFPNQATGIQVIAGYGPTTGTDYEFETAYAMDGRTQNHGTAPQITFIDVSEVIIPSCAHISTTGAIESTIGTTNTDTTNTDTTNTDTTNTDTTNTDTTTIGTIMSTIDAIRSTIGTIMSTSATDTTADISTTIGTTNNYTTTTTSRPDTTIETTQTYTTTSSSKSTTTHEGNANSILNGIYIGYVMCFSLYLVL